MKIAILAVLGLLGIAGGIFAAASLGFLPIPGISPTNFGKPVKASTNQSRTLLATLGSPLQTLSRSTATQAAKPLMKPKPADTRPAGPNPDLGDAKLAELWNSMDPAKLASITEKWPPNNLAKILIKMDSDQVSDYLAALTPDRARALSGAIQQVASLPPPAPAQPTS